MILLYWLMKNREDLLSAYLLGRYSIVRLKGFIKQAKMVFKHRNFILYAIIRVLLLTWLKLLLDILLVDLLISVGIQVVRTKLTITHSCSLSIRKLNILLSTVMNMQYIVMHHMALHLVKTMIYKYQTNQIKAGAVM
jgi:hypothetical protein